MISYILNFRLSIPFTRKIFFNQAISQEFVIPINAHKINIYYNPITVIESNNSILPTQYRLHQSYPNPFKPTTTIKYSVPPLLGGAGGGLVTLKIFDTLGREIQTLVNKIQQPGTYKVKFNGEGLPSGIYIYKLIAGTASFTRKMMLVE